MNTMERARSNDVMPNQIPHTGAAGSVEEALDTVTLAELDDNTLAAMARNELARVIVASGHPWRVDGLEAQLPFADRPTLLRMAFLARVCSRHRLQLAQP